MSEEIAFAAGLFEGEGWAGVGSNHGGRTRSGSMQIQMCDREPLERFFEAVGAGKLYGPYQRKGVGRPIYRWIATRSKEVHHVARLLWPFLSPRRQQQLETAIAAYRGDNWCTKSYSPQMRASPEGSTDA